MKEAASDYVLNQIRDKCGQGETLQNEWEAKEKKTYQDVEGCVPS